MRPTRLVPLLGLSTLLALAIPAHAENQLLHMKFNRALAVAQLDSTLFTLTTTSFDTSASVFTEDIPSNITAQVDTAGQLASYPAAAGIGLPKNLWLVVEVTGALQNADSIYVRTQYSQGSVPRGTGETNVLSGQQDNAANWRWYDGRAFAGVVENNTASKTWIFPVPCAGSDPNTWLGAKAMRWIIQGDTAASSVGIGARAWLVWRNR